MDNKPCHCTGNNTLAKYQFISDLFISVAYFSIPLELLYLTRKDQSLAPYRGILLQFGLFIVLCGATHFISLWSAAGDYDETVDTIRTVAKALCALVSCATALSLIGMIRDFLAYKLELCIKNKAADDHHDHHDADAEKGLVS